MARFHPSEGMTWPVSVEQGAVSLSGGGMAVGENCPCGSRSLCGRPCQDGSHMALIMCYLEMFNNLSTSMTIRFANIKALN